MVESRTTRLLLRLGAVATLTFIYLPLVLVAFYAFNESITQRWPIDVYFVRRGGELIATAVEDSLP